MPDIHDIALRRLDVSVLLVFLGLLRHRKATRVAQELGLTQSAVSHALKRLREVFGDPLFLRLPHGLEPTAVALDLEGRIAGALELLRGALGEADSFHPAEAQGVVRFAAHDAEQVTLVPGLVARLQAEAPGLRLAVFPLGRRAALDALAAGTVDLAVGFFPRTGPGFVAEPLYAQGYRVVGRAEVLGEAKEIDLQRYIALPHVLVSPVGDLRGIVDDTLAQLGRERRVVAAVPQFLPALATVAATGCIATIPERIAKSHARRMGLVDAAPPLALRSFTVSALRHRRNERDGRLRWLTGLVREILADQDR